MKVDALGWGGGAWGDGHGNLNLSSKVCQMTLMSSAAEMAAEHTLRNTALEGFVWLV